LPHVLDFENFKTMILYVEKSMPLNSKACDGAILQYQNPLCGIVKKFG
jgi:hypothetical protein